MFKRITFRRPLKFGLTLVGVSVLFLILAVVGLALPIMNRINSNPSGNSFANSLLPPAFAGFDSNTLRIFDGYASWPTSVALKTDDTRPQIFSLLSQYWSSNNLNHQIDINGDGLTDLLYHSVYNGGYPYYFGIFLNKGNLQYDLAYKCAYTVVSNVPHYYGDCADTSSSTNTLLSDIFNNYVAWPNSVALKATDQMPEALQTLTHVFNATNYTTIADMNGDGLADILYHNGQSLPMRYAVFLNKGNLQYDFAYKCVVGSVSNNYHFYGDCADTSSTTQSGYPSSLSNYTTWPHSANINANDTMVQTLYLMSHTVGDSSGEQFSSIIDMNGDGLPDIVEHTVPSYMPTRFDFAVYFNKGNLQFTLGYKCVSVDRDGYGNGQIWDYYGDCAG